MPDFSFEFHDRGSEWVFTGDLDVDEESSTLVWSIWRTPELSTKMCEVIAIAGNLDGDVGVGVGLDISNLLLNAAVSVGGHDTFVRWERVLSQFEKGGNEWTGGGAEPGFKEVGSRLVTSNLIEAQRQPEAARRQPI